MVNHIHRGAMKLRAFVSKQITEMNLRALCQDGEHQKWKPMLSDQMLV